MRNADSRSIAAHPELYCTRGSSNQALLTTMSSAMTAAVAASTMSEAASVRKPATPMGETTSMDSATKTASGEPMLAESVMKLMVIVVETIIAGPSVVIAVEGGTVVTVVIRPPVIVVVVRPIVTRCSHSIPIAGSVILIRTPGQRQGRQPAHPQSPGSNQSLQSLHSYLPRHTRRESAHYGRGSQPDAGRQDSLLLITQPEVDPASFTQNLNLESELIKGRKR